MRISIRKMEKKDIPLKVKWINDARNHQLFYTMSFPLINRKQKYGSIKQKIAQIDLTELLK